MPTAELARLFSNITRAEMAKIITVFAITFQNKQADETNQACTSFTDISNLNTELQNYVQQSCKLGLMGYWSDGLTVNEAFRPNDYVTRAEF